MKKTLLFVLTLAMILSLCACGEKTATPDSSAGMSNQGKEEMLANASELKLDDFVKEVEDNKLRAEDTYLNNCYKVTTYVISIEDGYAKIGSPTPNGYCFNAYLSTDDLKQLGRGEKITIVGEIGSLDLVSEEKSVAGTSYTSNSITVEMPTAYLVTNRYDVTGQIEMYYMTLLDVDGKIKDRTGLESAWYLAIKDNNGTVFHLENAIPVEHQAGKNVTSISISETEVNNKASITLSGKIINKEIQNGGWSYDSDLLMSDVELVSIN